MDKPKKKSKKAYDWNECTKYIEEKYGIDIRNYAGTKFNGKANDAPYQDFWHWIVDKCDVHNGCYIYLGHWSKDEFDEPWQYDIYKMYYDEFADKNSEMTFWCWW